MKYKGLLIKDINHYQRIVGGINKLNCLLTIGRVVSTKPNGNSLPNTPPYVPPFVPLNNLQQQLNYGPGNPAVIPNLTTGEPCLISNFATNINFPWSLFNQNTVTIYETNNDQSVFWDIEFDKSNNGNVTAFFSSIGFTPSQLPQTKHIQLGWKLPSGQNGIIADLYIQADGEAYYYPQKTPKLSGVNLVIGKYPYNINGAFSGTENNTFPITWQYGSGSYEYYCNGTIPGNTLAAYSIEVSSQSNTAVLAYKSSNGLYNGSIDTYPFDTNGIIPNNPLFPFPFDASLQINGAYWDY